MSRVYKKVRLGCPAGQRTQMHATEIACMVVGRLGSDVGSLLGHHRTNASLIGLFRPKNGQITIFSPISRLPHKLEPPTSTSQVTAPVKLHLVLIITYPTLFLAQNPIFQELSTESDGKLDFLACICSKTCDTRAHTVAR